MQLLLVLALVFASFVAVFALQNAQTVPIRLFAWERETSVAVIVLAAAAVGALSAALAGFVRQLSAGLRNRQLRGELARTQKRLEEEKEARARIESELEDVKARLEAPSPAAQAPPETASPEIADPERLSKGESPSVESDGLKSPHAGVPSDEAPDSFESKQPKGDDPQ